MRSLSIFSMVSTVRWWRGRRETCSKSSFTKAGFTMRSRTMRSMISQMASPYRKSIRFSGIWISTKSFSSAIRFISSGTAGT